MKLTHQSRRSCFIAEVVGLEEQQVVVQGWRAGQGTPGIPDNHAPPPVILRPRHGELPLCNCYMCECVVDSYLIAHFS